MVREAAHPGRRATYNLLVDPWIPVRRESGDLSWIAPHQIAERDDPPIRIDSARPDFDGALIQFLIGLVQTTMAPKTHREWEKLLRKPPAPRTLRRQLSAVQDAFWLDGDGPRFMQSLAADEVTPRDKRTGISGLLIDAPGASTIKANRDLFNKRGAVEQLGLASAATALFTLQTNAPSGGQGHRTSLRGGGPLSTVVVGRTLWHTVVMNLLREEVLLSGPGRRRLRDSAATFPWLVPECIGGGRREVTPDDVHPAHHYWGMPRRIRLCLDGARGTCDLTGHRDVPIVRAHVTKPHGMNYVGAFRHPLTPYARPKKAGDVPYPRKAHATGLPYREWSRLVLPTVAGEPARVVAAFHEGGRGRVVAGDPSLWVFGYDMDNMKARCWYQQTTPLLHLDSDLLHGLSEDVARCVEASEHCRKSLAGAVKAAMFRRPQDARGDTSFVSRSFWSRTEPAFFATVSALRDALQNGTDSAPIVEQWLLALHEAALEVFRMHAQERGDFVAMEIGRVAKAWNELHRRTSPENRKLRELVHVPVAASIPTRRSA